MSWLWLLACVDPFQNQAPRLEAINGVEVVHKPFDTYVPSGEDALWVEPGDVFEVELDVVDDEGHGIWVWWPNAPAGWTFAPEDRRGVWVVPDDADVEPLQLILQDDHPDNPRSALYDIPLWGPVITDPTPSGYRIR